MLKKIVYILIGINCILLIAANLDMLLQEYKGTLNLSLLFLLIAAFAILMYNKNKELKS